MKSTFLIGCVGNPNFGDETMMRAWIENYRKEDQSSIIICDTLNEAVTQKYLNRLNYSNVHIIPSELSLYKTNNFIRKNNDRFLIRDRNGFFNYLEKLSSYLEEFNVHNIHLYGGGYLNSLWLHHLPIILGAKILSTNLETSLVATGQGFIPWSDSIDQYMRCLSLFDIVDVRDYESLNVFQKKNINKTARYSGDDALLLFQNEDNFALKKETHPSLVICLQTDLFAGEEIFKTIFSEEILSIFYGRGIRNINFVSAMKNDFPKLTKEIKEKIKKSGMDIFHINEEELLHTGIPFNLNSFFITTRYHIHLLASLSGANGIALFSNEYYKNKHSAVKDMGSLWQVKDTASLKQDSLKNVIKESLQSDNAYNESLLNFWVEKKRKLAKQLDGII